MKYSQTPQEERIKTLQSLVPEAFDEGKIDWEKLKATLGEDVNFANERYVLNWAGKSDAFRVMQQPSSATLVPCREESVEFENTENIFIEGENMEVLKILQKSYFGKVKMIYIDPPYNTGNDSFIYPDKFSETKEEYLKRVGDKDEEGYMTREGMFRKNSKENGQYHSNWLNMMMPRLYLAKALLREDGVIFVSIDDNEVHNLRLLMNEIFGEENFVTCISRATGTPTGGGFDIFVNELDYILVYAKQAEELSIDGLEMSAEDAIIYNMEDERGKYLIRPLRRTGGEDRREDRPTMFYPIIAPDSSEVYPYGPTGYESRWICSKTKYEELVAGGLIYWKQNEDTQKWQVYQKFYLEDRTKQPGNLWTTEEGNKKATRDVRELFETIKVFDFPKPIGVVTKLLKLGTNINNNDIVLDFFAGSATTAHAVMQLNKEDGGHRKYICVQLPELCDEKSEAFKAGYKTIAEISKERIRRSGAKIRKEVEEDQAKQKEKLQFGDEHTVEMPDLGFKVFKLSESNFKQWREIKGSDKEEWKQQMLDFLNPVAENATTDNMVYELLLKSGKSLNSTIEHHNGFYAINSKELILMLESATQETVDAILAEHPQKVIALDNLFEGNDQLKTNTALQMRDAGVEFRTI